VLKYRDFRKGTVQEMAKIPVNIEEEMKVSYLDYGRVSSPAGNIPRAPAW
jgi:hypothetical protein